MLGIIAVCGFWSGDHGVVAQSHPAASELVQKLRSPEATDDVRKQLLRLGKSDPEVQHYLAAELPSMIEMGPKSCPPSDIADVTARWHACPWYKAVELAGQLKIEEAAPAPWVD